jgi:hypothetical protein
MAAMTFMAKTGKNGVPILTFTPVDSSQQTNQQNNMTTIEELLNTIEQLKDIAQQALELAEAYSGGESEVEEELRENLKIILDNHHAND